MDPDVLPDDGDIELRNADESDHDEVFERKSDNVPLLPRCSDAGPFSEIEPCAVRGTTTIASAPVPHAFVARPE